MILPRGARARHVETGGAALHVVEAGPADAPALLLLHGWPEFWAGWARLIPLLASEFRLIAPDLRGFAGSAGAGPARDVATHVSDQFGLLDALGIERAGIVSHDVGAQVAQQMALDAPGRVRGLFFGNCPYPGIGRRWVEDGQTAEIWYQSFNQQPWAPALVGHSRESCRLYIGHFLAHWSADPHTFDDVIEDWVDAFLVPGALAGGFAWYGAANAGRLAQIAHGAQPRAPITRPTRVLWGAEDPVLRAAWTDGLEAYFTDLTVEIAEGVGHFVFYEAPEAAAPRIRAFFDGLAA